ncbi:MAG: hypothetical protein AB7V56_06440 [Candidatus Nitrosocosmicus sp.]
MVQPYLVGSKNSKSVAVIIPSDIVKKCEIDTSTVFMVKYDNTAILLQFMNIDNENKLIHVDTSLESKDQHVTISH